MDKSKSYKNKIASKPPKLIEWPLIVLLLIMVLYATLFSVIAIQRYHSFSFYDLDLAVINQNFYNASRGVLTSPGLGIHAILSGHKWFIIFPLLPIYLLFPGPQLLLVIQSIVLACGSWAVFLLVRHLTTPFLGLAMAIAYLIYPALQFVNLFEFHPIAFATPLLLFTFYFLITGRWGWYLAFVVLSLSVRQDVAISVFALGVFSLITVRQDRTSPGWQRWRWGLVPIGASIIWFYVCLSVIPRLIAGSQPGTSPEMVESFFGWLGRSPGEIITTILTRPVFVLRRIIIPPKLTYVWQLLSPVTLLPLLSPAGLLMVLISMTEGLLSERFSHFSIRYQYSSIITPMIFAASALGLRNLLNWKPFKGRGKYAGAAICLVAAITAWSFGPLPRLTRQLPGWRFTREDAVRQAMVENVPPTAPVTATFEFTPKLSNRPRMFFFYIIYAAPRYPNWTPRIPIIQEYSEKLVVDFNDWLTFYDFYTPGGDQAVYSFLREGNWELAATVNSLALFRRGESFAPGVAETVAAGEGTYRPAAGMPGLEVGPASARTGEELGFPVLRFSADLRSAQAPLPDILFVVRLVNRSNPGEVIQQFLMAPYRVYPPHRWPAGETVRIRANILLPEKLPSGSWDLQLLGLSRKEGLQLSPEATAAFYRHFDTAMALNYLPRIWSIPPDQMLDQHQILYIPRVLSLP